MRGSGYISDVRFGQPDYSVRKGVFMKVVLFGLGSMGFSIALNMLKGGHRVWGVDVDAKKVAALVAQGGEPTAYSEHLSDIDAVVLTVVNEAQVTSVLLDDPRLCDQLHEHSIIICLSTCLLYTSPSPRDLSTSRMPSSA